MVPRLGLWLMAKICQRQDLTYFFTGRKDLPIVRNLLTRRLIGQAEKGKNGSPWLDWIVSLPQPSCESCRTSWFKIPTHWSSKDGKSMKNICSRQALS